MNFAQTKSIDLAKGKKLKYGNKKVEVKGLKFDSKKEAKRYFELELLQKQGAISELVLKPKSIIILEANKNHKAKRYTPDFSYICHERLVYEDSKSDYFKKTELWRLKEMLIKDYCSARDILFVVS